MGQAAQDHRRRRLGVQGEAAGQARAACGSCHHLGSRLFKRTVWVPTRPAAHASPHAHAVRPAHLGVEHDAAIVPSLWHPYLQRVAGRAAQQAATREDGVSGCGGWCLRSAIAPT